MLFGFNSPSYSYFHRSPATCAGLLCWTRPSSSSRLQALFVSDSSKRLSKSCWVFTLHSPSKQASCSETFTGFLCFISRRNFWIRILCSQHTHVEVQLGKRGTNQPLVIQFYLCTFPLIVFFFLVCAKPSGKLICFKTHWNPDSLSSDFLALCFTSFTCP